MFRSQCQKVPSSASLARTVWQVHPLQTAHGHEQPDGGSVTVGETVQLGYVDQSRDDLDGSGTVWEEVSDGLDIIRIGTYEVPSRSYIGRFNFMGWISRSS